MFQKLFCEQFKKLVLCAQDEIQNCFKITTLTFLWNCQGQANEDLLAAECRHVRSSAEPVHLASQSRVNLILSSFAANN